MMIFFFKKNFFFLINKTIYTQARNMTAVRLINTFILRQRMREVVQLIFPSMSGRLDVKVVSYIHTYQWFLYNSI